MWLIAHAVFHLWEVAVGICSPSVIVRDFPAVTLPALIGIALTAWAWRSYPSKVRHAEQSAADVTMKVKPVSVMTDGKNG